MNHIEANHILKRIIDNAEIGVESRRGKWGEEQINAYPLELIELYVYGGYLKKRTMTDLDLIATYNKLSESDYRRHLKHYEAGRNTFKEAADKLISPYDHKSVHLQLHPLDYDFKVRLLVGGKPYGEGNPIDVYQRIWFNTKVEL